MQPRAAVADHGQFEGKGALSKNPHPAPPDPPPAGDPRRKIRSQIKGQKRASRERIPQRLPLRRRFPNSHDLAPRLRVHRRQESSSMSCDSNMVVHAASVRARGKPIQFNIWLEGISFVYARYMDEARTNSPNRTSKSICPCGLRSSPGWMTLSVAWERLTALSGLRRPSS